jgi:hypothetical protein
MKWFGKNWGAPICEDVEHVQTPTGAPCLHCRFPIEPDDAGFVMPLVHADGSVTFEATHRLCQLRTILPHGPECEHCRGLERRQHETGCAYVKCGDNCNCQLGDDMLRITDPKTTLSEVREMAERAGIPWRDLVEAGQRGAEFVEDLKRRRAAHNPSDAPEEPPQRKPA